MGIGRHRGSSKRSGSGKYRCSIRRRASRCRCIQTYIPLHILQLLPCSYYYSSRGRIILGAEVVVVDPMIVFGCGRSSSSRRLHLLFVRSSVTHI